MLVEHNFGNRFFRWLHLPILRNSNVGLIAFGGAGWTAMTDGTRSLQTLPTLEARRPFYEIGFGIDKILSFLRLDFAWRLNHFRDGRNAFIGISISIPF